MHYLITGHTGFKGSWLALMLEMQGHTVSGIALDPPAKSLFNQAELSPIFKHDLRLDIRDRAAMKQAVEMIDPEVIIHLAAQPLVRESYRIPVETFDINVLGTLNILEATCELKNLKAALIITTDKVYKNHNHLRGYVESDELGGDDPYSASKAAADIAAQSWIKSFAKVPMAIARAGNVIGGGDWAQDRIIPDLVNAYSVGYLPTLRYPDAIRPWQHVLDCLDGYLKLINHQLSIGVGGEWNFGPTLGERHAVAELAGHVASQFGLTEKSWQLSGETQVQESNYLLLDSTKARTALSWNDKLDFECSINWTIEWYRIGIENCREFTISQIRNFFDFQNSVERIS
jgi:CDP-glucose 4,6-dehydratase